MKIIDNKPIFIAGLPRSGTTWFGEVFSSAHNTHYVFEPDNEGLHPAAWLGKHNLHRFPYLTAVDQTPEDYYRLWSASLHGHPIYWYLNGGLGYLLRRGVTKHINYALEAYIGEKCGLRYLVSDMHWVGSRIVKPYSPDTRYFSKFIARQFLSHRFNYSSRKKVIIKSVHSPLSLDWLSGRFDLNLIVVLRNPYSLFASYKRMRLPDGFRNVFHQPLLQRDQFMYIPKDRNLTMPNQEDLMVFQIMLMYKIIEMQAKKHPEWKLISHDRLCINPIEDFNNLFDEFGLQWTEGTDKKIASLNKPGKGFEPSRISSQQPFKWKSELNQKILNSIQYWEEVFDVKNFIKDHISL